MHADCQYRTMVFANNTHGGALVVEGMDLGPKALDSIKLSSNSVHECHLEERKSSDACQ
jgi:hypothetical protein